MAWRVRGGENLPQLKKLNFWKREWGSATLAVLEFEINPPSKCGMGRRIKGVGKHHKLLFISSSYAGSGLEASVSKTY